MSGLYSINGFPDRPVRVAITIVDIATAWTGVTGILSALVHRNLTGTGQRVDVNLYDTALSLQILPLSEYLTAGRTPERFGNHSQLGAPAGLFQTADGEIVLSAYFQEQWAALAEVIEMPNLLSDARFVDNESRLRNQEALYELIVPKLRTKDSAAWHADFTRRGIIAGLIASYADVEADNQVDPDGILVETFPGGRKVRSVGLPIKFSDSVAPPTSPAPSLRQQSHDAGNA
jgi:crotonobetainyl-CoA:carnitine CoA-transferase CaiB-like acyl-CoA transferase